MYAYKYINIYMYVYMCVCKQNIYKIAKVSVKYIQ